MRERFRKGRDAVVPRLRNIPGVTIDEPRAAFYAFFRVDGIDDTLEYCKRLYAATNVGIAPGAAFGPEGEGWLRLCFASDVKRLAVAMERLEQFMAAKRCAPEAAAPRAPRRGGAPTPGPRRGGAGPDG